MAITLTFSHRVDGTLTNATSVVLSDPTGTYGVRRTDTSATVVADGTAMTNASTGVYTYVLTEPAAALTYQYYVEWVYGGLTHRAEFSAIGARDGADWEYADEQDVIDLIGEDSLKQISNVGTDASTVNSDRVQRAGESADAWINARLSRMGYTVPLANMDANTTRMMTDLSTRLTAIELNKARGILALGGTNGNKLQRAFDEMNRETLSMFRNIQTGYTRIVADREYDLATPIESVLPDSVIRIEIS